MVESDRLGAANLIENALDFISGLVSIGHFVAKRLEEFNEAAEFPELEMREAIAFLSLGMQGSDRLVIRF